MASNEVLKSFRMRGVDSTSGTIETGTYLVIEETGRPEAPVAVVLDRVDDQRRIWITEETWRSLCGLQYDVRIARKASNGDDE